jgi:hypothetical protein
MCRCRLLLKRAKNIAPRWGAATQDVHFHKHLTAWGDGTLRDTLLLLMVGPARLRNLKCKESLNLFLTFR